MLSSFYRWCFYLFFACLPFQVNALLVSGDVFFSGFFNPYLSHFIYVGDLFFLFGGLGFGLSLIFTQNRKKWRFKAGDRAIFVGFILLILASFLSLLVSTDVWNSLIYCLRFLQMFGVYLLVVNDIVSLRGVLWSFVSAMALVSVIGISQYVLQHSLGVRFFGEPVVSSQDLGVAKIGLFDRDVMRAYGTFAHPNIFGGYLVVAIFSLLLLGNRDFVRDGGGLRFLMPLGFLFFLALIVSFSRSAFVAMGFGLILLVFWLGRKISINFWKLILLLLCAALVLAIRFDLLGPLFARLDIFNDQAIIERLQYMVISFDMFLNNLFGVGVGNFTSVMQDFSIVKLAPWSLQPVHNIFLLSLNELGIFGVLALLILFAMMFYRSALRLDRLAGVVAFILVFVLFVLGNFDHYLLSLYQGQMLFAMVVGLVAKSS